MVLLKTHAPVHKRYFWNVSKSSTGIFVRTTTQICSPFPRVFVTSRFWNTPMLISMIFEAFLNRARGIFVRTTPQNCTRFRAFSEGFGDGCFELVLKGFVMHFFFFCNPFVRTVTAKRVRFPRVVGPPTFTLTRCVLYGRWMAVWLTPGQGLLWPHPELNICRVI